MKWIENVARPEILTLVPYSSARSEYSGKGGDEVQLDANENPWKPRGQSISINRYPEPQSAQLKRKIAELYGVAPEQLLITRGADEGIDLLIRTFCRPEHDAIVTAPPTFGSYGIYANIQSVKVVNVPLNAEDFSLNWSAMMLASAVKIVFVCTPNNPTGSVVPFDHIQVLCEFYKERAIVVVDEAYIDFANAPSVLMLLKQYSNLVVLRTFSKAYSLAGARIGVVVGHTDIVALARKVLAPYPISTLCYNAALDALTPENLVDVKERVTILKKEREYLYQRLQQSNALTKVWPSAANFLLVITKDADSLYQTLKDKNVIVRNWNKVIPGGLRITVGAPDDNQKLLAALDLL